MEALTEQAAYDIAYRPAFGFIIVRHVNSKMTDYYWKEAYTCIRRWYTEPILIVDDNSNPAFLNDNMALVDCTIVHDTQWKGCGELLGYYYFHTMKPFETAVIIHDSVFIQKRVSFDLDGANMKILWSFLPSFCSEIEPYYHELCKNMPIFHDVLGRYCSQSYLGCFGLMSVIRWDFLDKLVEDGLFSVLPEIKKRRDARSAMERVLAIMAYRRDPTIQAIFGNIYHYIRWGTTFLEYLSGIGPNGVKIPDTAVVKVWTGR
jgi:hypothetical protein